MRVVKGEILRIKEKLCGFEKYGYGASIHTGELDEIWVLPCDSYGQTDERQHVVVSAKSVERTGRLIWEFDHTLFPHIIELLKEYYAFAIYNDGVEG